jgi:Protein of unknown function (DUF1566)/Carboxypeptidase regulatory-like domain
MRVLRTILVGFMLVVFLIGCGKKSTLEGKVIDGTGKPMAGVRVVAKQVQQDKGHAEITTGADGTFKLGKLSATTEYELIPYLDATIKGRSIKAESAPEGQTKKLPNPILVFFVPSKDGLLVRDTGNGLLWVKDAGKGGKMDWNAAMNMAKQFSFAGFSDWRLPTKNELRTLAAYGGKIPAEKLNSDVFTNVQADSYWSSNDEGNNLYAWAVNMKDGKVVNDNKSTTSYFVWLVRQGQ